MSVPHAGTIEVAGGVVEVAVGACWDASGLVGPDASRISIASGVGDVAGAIGLAEVRRHVPFAARIKVATGLALVACAAVAVACLACDVPFAQRVDQAAVEISQDRACGLAQVTCGIPIALDIGFATRGVAVREAAFLAADGTVPVAHLFTDAAALNDKSIVGVELHGVDGGTSTTTLLQLVAPHAPDVGFAGRLIEVLSDASFNTLSVGNRAQGVVGTFSDGESAACGFAAARGAVPAALRSRGASDLIGGGRAGSDANTVLGIPCAFAVGRAVGLREPAEVALLEATSAVPEAHRFAGADGLKSDAAADGAARSGAAIPHALDGVGEAVAVVHLIASGVASVVGGPLAECIGVASSRGALDGGFLLVVGASVFAHHGVVVPAA